jgi:hypothetical protein
MNSNHATYYVRHIDICIALTRFLMRMMYGSAKCADPRSTDVAIVGNVCFAFIVTLHIRPSFQAST